MTLLLLKLFRTFFVIGLFTFGGGYAVIGMIQSEVVSANGWVSESAFTDIVAISQMTPGPVGLNCSTYVGYEAMREAGAGHLLACIGSVTSSLAVVLPSFIVMLLLVNFYSKFHETPVFKGVMSALKPSVAGLIGASALVLMLSVNLGGGSAGLIDISIISENFPSWRAWILFAVAMILYATGKAGPMILLAGGAVAGILLF